MGSLVNKMLINCVEISCENLNRFWGIFWIFKECSELAEMLENKGIWRILLNRFYPLWLYRYFWDIFGLIDYMLI